MIAFFFFTTFHDLGSSDANFAGLVSGQVGTGFWVDDLELGVPDHGAARTRLDLEGLLGEGQTHGQHWPCLCHPIALFSNAHTTNQFPFFVLGLIWTISQIPSPACNLFRHGNIDRRLSRICHPNQTSCFTFFCGCGENRNSPQIPFALETFFVINYSILSSFI